MLTNRDSFVFGCLGVLLVLLLVFTCDWNSTIKEQKNYNTCEYIFTEQDQKDIEKALKEERKIFFNAERMYTNVRKVDLYFTAYDLNGELREDFTFDSDKQTYEVRSLFKGWKIKGIRIKNPQDIYSFYVEFETNWGSHGHDLLRK